MADREEGRKRKCNVETNESCQRLISEMLEQAYKSHQEPDRNADSYAHSISPESETGGRGEAQALPF